MCIILLVLPVTKLWRHKSYLCFRKKYFSFYSYYYSITILSFKIFFYDYYKRRFKLIYANNAIYL